MGGVEIPGVGAGGGPADQAVVGNRAAGEGLGVVTAEVEDASRDNGQLTGQAAGDPLEDAGELVADGEGAADEHEVGVDDRAVDDGATTGDAVEAVAREGVARLKGERAVLQFDGCARSHVEGAGAGEAAREKQGAALDIHEAGVGEVEIGPDRAQAGPGGFAQGAGIVEGVGGDVRGEGAVLLEINDAARLVLNMGGVEIPRVRSRGGPDDQAGIGDRATDISLGIVSAEVQHAACRDGQFPAHAPGGPLEGLSSSATTQGQGVEVGAPVQGD